MQPPLAEGTTGERVADEAPRRRHHRDMFPVHALTGTLPLKCDTTGKKSVPGLRLLERLFPLRGLVEGPGGITFDGAHPSERLLFYYFHNVLRHYRSSPLSHYLSLVLRPGDTFLDVGAHLGLYSYLARRLGCTASLFEPEPRFAAFLERNHLLLGSVFPFALCEAEGERDFYVGTENNSGASSLVMSSRGWEASGYARRVRVRCRRMDQVVVGPEAIRGIRLVKIDVEGAEAAVVSGMERLLEQARPDIWCEVRGDSSDRNPGSYRDVCGGLEASGYRPYLFDGSTREPFCERKHAKRVFDLLFVTDDA